MRSNSSRSASSPLAAAARGWSAKRASISAAVASTAAALPRRCGSDSSSVACSRTATSASWSSARERSCAWTFPVATHSTPSRSASSSSRRLRARSRRHSGRCSSTRKRSRPNAAASRRPSASAAAQRRRAPSAPRAPRRARIPTGRPAPPSAARAPTSATAGGRGSRSGRSRVPRCASVTSRQRLRYPARLSTSSVTWKQPGGQLAGSPAASGGVSGVETVSSAPVIGRTPSPLHACANSIEPQSPSWSVSASAGWPSSAAAAASSSGLDAPSRNE